MKASRDLDSDGSAWLQLDAPFYDQLDESRDRDWVTGRGGMSKVLRS